MFGVNYSQSVRFEIPKIAQDIRCIETIQLVIKPCIKSLQIGFSFVSFLMKQSAYYSQESIELLSSGKFFKQSPD